MTTPRRAEAQARMELGMRLPLDRRSPIPLDELKYARLWETAAHWVAARSESPDVLEALLEEHPPAVAASVLANPSAPRELVRKLIDDHAWEEHPEALEAISDGALSELLAAGQLPPDLPDDHAYALEKGIRKRAEAGSDVALAVAEILAQERRLVGWRSAAKKNPNYSDLLTRALTAGHLTVALHLLAECAGNDPSRLPLELVDQALEQLDQIPVPDYVPQPTRRKLRLPASTVDRFGTRPTAAGRVVASICKELTVDILRTHPEAAYGSLTLELRGGWDAEAIQVLRGHVAQGVPRAAHAWERLVLDDINYITSDVATLSAACIALGWVGGSRFAAKWFGHAHGQDFTPKHFTDATAAPRIWSDGELAKVMDRDLNPEHWTEADLENLWETVNPRDGECYAIQAVMFGDNVDAWKLYYSLDDWDGTDWERIRTAKALAEQ